MGHVSTCTHQKNLDPPAWLRSPNLRKENLRAPLGQVIDKLTVPAGKGPDQPQLKEQGNAQPGQDQLRSIINVSGKHSGVN